MGNMKYAALITTVKAEGDDDTQATREFFTTCDLAGDLGFEAVWITEHHFSDYHPAPNPLMLLSHVAARRPKLGLGTAVLVTPWHQPVKLAGEIAMLSQITDAPIYIGMGRGNAPLEYEAFGVPMSEALERFAECWEIVRKAFEGKPFTYDGKVLKVEREVGIHPAPRPEQVTFLGAIGQPGSAGRIGALGLAAMVNANTSAENQRQILANWEAAISPSVDTSAMPRVVSPWMIIADTDEEAEALAHHHLAEQLRLSAAHYVIDKDKHASIPGFEYLNARDKQRREGTDAERVRPFMEQSFVGSPKTVARKMQALIDVGFDYFLVNTSMPHTPHELRRKWLARFVNEVVPLVSEPARQTNAA